MQPAETKSEDEKEVIYMACLNNCNYNCMQQLARKLSLLWRIEQYVKDAEECGHPACAEVWIKIKDDEERHVEMLRLAVEGLSREGKLH